jgi:hypothetical protein
MTTETVKNSGSRCADARTWGVGGRKIMKTKALIAIGAVAVSGATGMTGFLGHGQTGHEDCIPYKADALRLTDLGDRGWQLSREDGAVFMVLVEAPLGK